MPPTSSPDFAMTQVRTRTQRRPLLACAALAAALTTFSLGGCAPEPDVVLYCALDQVFSEELVREFERETGLRVRAEFDVEAQKTVGLVRRLREEAARPRCDVFWNNEIAHTVSLAEDGLLSPYDSPSAADIPEEFRDPQRRWTGFAARARVFIVNILNSGNFLPGVPVDFEVEVPALSFCARTFGVKRIAQRFTAGPPCASPASRATGLDDLKSARRARREER
jgi:hypothetical protein